MAAVADQADVAVGGLYRYFANKDALLAALQVRAVGTFGEVLDQVLEGRQDPVARLRGAAQAWFRFAQDHPEEFELLDRSLSDPSPNLDDAQALAVDEALRPVLGRVTTELQAAADAGTLVPGEASLRARVLWAAVHGAAHFRKRDRLGGPTAQQVLQASVDTLISGWSARE